MGEMAAKAPARGSGGTGPNSECDRYMTSSRGQPAVYSSRQFFDGVRAWPMPRLMRIPAVIDS